MKSPSDRTMIRPVILSSFSPPALACIRSWGKYGFQTGMVCIRSSKESPPDSRYLSDFASLDPGDIHTETGLKVIHDFLNKFAASGILAINEDLTCWLKATLPANGCHVPVWGPSISTIRSLLSKQNQLNAARQVGFDMLPTYVIDNRIETTSSIPEDSFPLCLRPDDPQSIHPTFKVRLTENRDDLTRFVTGLEKLKKPLLGQPFMNLPNLVVHGARSVTGKAFALNAFLVENKFQGVTLTIRSVSLEETLRQRCIEFMNAFEFTGNYHFEFLMDRSKDKAYFLEVNGRLGGTTAKVWACGYDEPMLALESHGVCENSRWAIRNCTVSSKHALLKHALYAIRGKLTPLDFPIKPKIMKILLSLYGILRYRDEVLDIADLRGTMTFYRGLFANRS